MKISEGTKTTLPGTSIESTWVLVTPDLAKHYLSCNTENRAIRPKHTNRLTHDMNEDRFKITHQGIAFDENGVLIDGQHRLNAIVASGKGQWLLVTTGLPSKSKQVVDNGARRRAADFMPGAYRDQRAAVVRILLAVTAMEGPFTAQQLAYEIQQVTDSAIQAAWDVFSDDFDELCGMSHEAAKNVATCGPAALLSAALVYPKRRMEWLEGLKTMVGLTPGDPRLALLRFRGGPKRIQTPVAAFVSMKAAKAFDSEKEMNLLRYSPTEKLKI